MTMFARLVEASRRVAETSRRTEKTETLAGLLRRLAPDEIEAATAFLSGSARQGRIGIGYSTLLGSMGGPAPQPVLSILDVDRALEEIAGTGGRGSAQLRRELLRSLFHRATGPEQQFLIGLMTVELRQGALEGMMIDAVAKAAGIGSDRVRRAVMMAGSVPPVARAALVEGEAALSRYDLRLFRPVQPMLAQTAEDVSAAIAELGETELEYKMDGARVQVHKSGEDVVAYSRALNDVTGAVPEVVEAVRRLPARDLILDGEVLSFDRTGRPQPFQVTARRFNRKLDVERLRSDLPLTPVWFDLLYLNGSSMVDEPQRRRFAELAGLAPPELLVPHLVTADAETAETFIKQAITAGHEGVMAKAVDAAYAAGARGQSWLKIKQAHTLDLVILAAEWGHGRRRGRLSNLHLGARDTEKGGFAMLGKTFKGLTDEMLAWQTQELLKREIARDGETVYVRPEMVAEIAFNDLQVSPRYPSGLALRFARVKRYRPDKPAAEADTFQTVRMMAGLSAA
jgi:DNA ligase-1